MNRSLTGKMKMGRAFLAKRIHLGKSVLGEITKNPVWQDISLGKKSQGQVGTGLKVLDFTTSLHSHMLRCQADS